MKTISLLLLSLILIIEIHAQNKNNSTLKIDLKGARFVHIKLEGKIILENTTSSKMIIDYSSEKSGHIIGLSNEEEIKPYNIVSRLDGDEVIIQSVKREKMWSIGINTYNEKNIHYLHIPSNINIIIETHLGDVSINGNFPFIKVNNVEGNTAVSTKRNSYKFIECVSKEGNVDLNDEETGKKLTLLGNGNKVIIVNSKEGEIDLHLLPEENHVN